MKSPGPDNLLSWKRPLRTSQRLPETSSSAQRSSFPDGDELPVISTTRSRVTERRSGATARGRAIGLHSLTFGTGIAQRNGDLKVEAIPFDRECDDLAQHLRTTMTEGLAETEAQVRRKEYGDNILKDQEKPTVFKVLWRQVSNAMTVILVAAMIIAVAIDDDAESGFIAGTWPPSSPSF